MQNDHTVRPREGQPLAEELADRDGSAPNTYWYIRWLKEEGLIPKLRGASGALLIQVLARVNRVHGRVLATRSALAEATGYHEGHINRILRQFERAGILQYQGWGTHPSGAVSESWTLVKWRERAVRPLDLPDRKRERPATERQRPSPERQRSAVAEGSQLVEAECSAMPTEHSGGDGLTPSEAVLFERAATAALLREHGDRYAEEDSRLPGVNSDWVKKMVAKARKQKKPVENLGGWLHQACRKDWGQKVGRGEPKRRPAEFENISTLGNLSDEVWEKAKSAVVSQFSALGSTRPASRDESGEEIADRVGRTPPRDCPEVQQFLLKRSRREG